MLFSGGKLHFKTYYFHTNFIYKNGRFVKIFGFNFFDGFFLKDKATIQKNYNNKCLCSMSNLSFGINLIKKFQLLWILWLQKYINLVKSMIFSKIIGISLLNLCQINQLTSRNKFYHKNFFEKSLYPWVNCQKDAQYSLSYY